MIYYRAPKLVEGENIFPLTGEGLISKACLSCLSKPLSFKLTKSLGWLNLGQRGFREK